MNTGWPEEKKRFSTEEKLLLIARLARGKSKLDRRAAEEEPVVDKLMELLDALDQYQAGGES